MLLIFPFSTTICQPAFWQDASLTSQTAITLELAQSLDSWRLSVNDDVEVVVKHGVYSADLCLIRDRAIAKARVIKIEKPSPNCPVKIIIEVTDVQTADKNGEMIQVSGKATLTGEYLNQHTTFDPLTTITVYPVRDYVIKAPSRR